ncbi:MAG TPA: hypothetical protein VF092_18040 [Longimicrobium sp.]
MAEAATQDDRPQRIYFRVFTEADEKKRRAESNRSPTGGGARDIRMNHEHFGPIMEKMLPNRLRVMRKREGARTQIEIYAGPLHYPVKPDEPEGEERTMQIEYEPPTTARGSEGRIPRIPNIPSLENLPEGDVGLIFLLLIQNARGELRAHYVTESSLRTEGWHPEVVQTILNCVTSTRRNRIAQGYIDFTIGRKYCHA